MGTRPPPSSTLFPYTTLFRSHPNGRPCPFPARSLSAGRQPLTAADHPHRVPWRSEEHTSELQSRPHLVCRLLLEKKNPVARDRPRYILQHDDVRRPESVDPRG